LSLIFSYILSANRLKVAPVLMQATSDSPAMHTPTRHTNPTPGKPSFCTSWCASRQWYTPSPSSTESGTQPIGGSGYSHPHSSSTGSQSQVAGRESPSPLTGLLPDACRTPALSSPGREATAPPRLSLKCNLRVLAGLRRSPPQAVKQRLHHG
jgi:hypothetical protein